VTLVVDPGVRKAGVSLWLGRTLIDSATIRAPEGKLAAAVLRWARARTPKGSALEVVVEQMVFYRRARVKHADLQRVEAMAGALRPTVRLTPGAWKGGCPKAVTRARLVRAGLVTADMGHDEVDAIGIGAVHLGVLGRGCVAR